MATATKTIADLQLEITSALQRIAPDHLPPALAGLGHLAPPPGFAVRVSLCYSGGRQIRSDADASYFTPESCRVVVKYEAANTQAAAADQAKLELPIEIVTKDMKHERDLRELVLALDAAERDPRFRDFVALKTFRDRFLPERGLDWAQDDRQRQAALANAISQGLIQTGKVPNPKAASFPVTSIRLDRANPVVKEILSSSAKERSAFAPVAIRGVPLSATVIAERR